MKRLYVFLAAVLLLGTVAFGACLASAAYDAAVQHRAKQDAVRRLLSGRPVSVTPVVLAVRG